MSTDYIQSGLAAKSGNGASNAHHRLALNYEAHGTQKTEPQSQSPQSQSPRPKAVEGDLVAHAGVKLKGEIASCKKFVVEGDVEAQLRAHELAVNDSGLFVGTAEVDRADIAGSFEGTLTVAGTLTIRSTGRVKGLITYGKIEIESGGEFSGRVSAGADKNAPGKAQAKLRFWFS